MIQSTPLSYSNCPTDLIIWINVLVLVLLNAITQYQTDSTNLFTYYTQYSSCSIMLFWFWSIRLYLWFGLLVHNGLCPYQTESLYQIGLSFGIRLIWIHFGILITHSIGTLIHQLSYLWTQSTHFYFDLSNILDHT